MGQMIEIANLAWDTDGDGESISGDSGFLTANTPIETNGGRAVREIDGKLVYTAMSRPSSRVFAL